MAALVVDCRSLLHNGERRLFALPLRIMADRQEECGRGCAQTEKVSVQEKLATELHEKALELARAGGAYLLYTRTEALEQDGDEVFEAVGCSEETPFGAEEMIRAQIKPYLDDAKTYADDERARSFVASNWPSHLQQSTEELRDALGRFGDDFMKKEREEIIEKLRISPTEAILDASSRSVMYISPACVETRDKRLLPAKRKTSVR